jgi:5-formyltetrahydrofolate cyclo-ligase
MLPANSIADLKKNLRLQMRAELKALAESADYHGNKTRMGIDAARILHESALYQNVDLVLSYVALGSEFDTGAINALVLADGKRLALPRITENLHMDFFLADPAIPLEIQLVKNKYGIWEPRQDCPAVGVPQKPAIMLVPGLAFSVEGKRLGRGKGYYDRYFNRYPEADIVRVGVCFECQMLEDVPVEAHDKRVGWVLTEKGLRELITP